MLFEVVYDSVCGVGFQFLFAVNYERGKGSGEQTTLWGMHQLLRLTAYSVAVEPYS
jgi:hypothetical protein